jgi:hypothetical protein
MGSAMSDQLAIAHNTRQPSHAAARARFQSDKTPYNSFLRIESLILAQFLIFFISREKR